jgi:serine-type D-Ala-D-Ala carboxypeptidase/endopeptidase
VSESPVRRTAFRTTAGHRSMGWPDLVCLGGIVVNVILSFVVIPLIPSLIGAHPVLLEALGGSTLSMAVAGSFARVGRVSLLVALSAPIVGLSAFDPFWWWAGRRYGAAVNAYLAHDARSARGVDRALRLFRRFGAATLLVAYYLPVPNVVLYAAAGWSGMGFLRFAALDLIGTLLHIVPAVALGFALGGRGVQVANEISRYSLIATVALVVLLFAVARWRRRRDRATGLPIVALTGNDLETAPVAQAVAEVVERHLRPLVENGTAPGLVYALITPSARGTGQVTASGGPPLGPDVILEIGSVTKVFTALLLADLAERGEVGLDDPIAAVLPVAVAASCPAAGRITLRQLATHTSGLPRIPRNLFPLALRSPGDPYAGYSTEHLYRALRRARGPAPADYAYSNYGFGLLGHLLALAAGRPYPQLLAERITGPLGLTETGVEAPAGHLVAVGHRAGQPVPGWHSDALAGAGALRSTAADLLRFLAANLDPGATVLRSVLLAAQDRQQPLAGGGAIGLGWHLSDRVGRSVMWHNGGTGGFSSMLALDHAAGCALAVVATTAPSRDAPLDTAVLAALAELTAATAAPPLG